MITAAEQFRTQVQHAAHLLSENGRAVLLDKTTTRFSAGADECVNAGLIVESDGSLTTLGYEVKVLVSMWERHGL